MVELQDVLALYRDEGSFAAVEALSRDPDPVAAAKTFGETASHYYWKLKDLAAAVAMARAGIQHALTAAARVEAGDAARALQLRGHGKGMAYNLASFTWPGWDEPGIMIGPSDLAAGLDAARTNLRLAISLNKGPLPLSRAYWMLAAHELAAGRYASAESTFGKAGEQAEAAGAEADRWLSAGFAMLAKLLAAVPGPGAGKNDVFEKSLAEVEGHLRPLENGEMFIEQIRTARRVFEGGAARGQG